MDCSITPGHALYTFTYSSYRSFMKHTRVGLLEHIEEAATRGVTIISPLHGTGVYLIGMKGEVLHQWATSMAPGNYARLLPNGNLLWSGQTSEGPKPGGGKGGLIREFDWEGNIVWEHRDDAQHHDFRRLANGNTLYIGWEEMPPDAAKRVVGAEAGTEAEGGTIWGDYLREVDSAGKTIWEWHTYSDLEIELHPLHIMSTRKEFAHCNSCAELPDGNLLLSFRKNSTLMIVDKETKKVKWYKRNDEWGQQHDAEMLSNGNILFFANGINVPRGIYHSRVIELNPKSGEEVWIYQGSPSWSFFSPNISGCQRLHSGNTLICEGLNGRIFEVTPDGQIVWDYISPWFGNRHPTGRSNAVFRAYRYDTSSSEIAGRLSLIL